jgi:hypothetical protein
MPHGTSVVPCMDGAHVTPSLPSASLPRRSCRSFAPTRFATHHVNAQTHGRDRRLQIMRDRRENLHAPGHLRGDPALHRVELPAHCGSSISFTAAENT